MKAQSTINDQRKEKCINWLNTRASWAGSMNTLWQMFISLTIERLITPAVSGFVEKVISNNNQVKLLFAVWTTSFNQRFFKGYVSK